MRYSAVVRDLRLMFRHQFVCVLLTLCALGLTTACRSTPATPAVSADAWAVVDGHAITSEDVDKPARCAAVP